MSIQSGKKYLTLTLIVIATLTVLIYASFRSYNFLQGPSITIKNPQNGGTLNQSLLTIEGKAKNIAFITLNDRQIYVEEDGTLREELLLQKGYNIISIKATDRFNRKVEKRLELVYEP